MANAYFGCPGNGGQHHIYYERHLIDRPDYRSSLGKLNETAGHDLVGLMFDKAGRLQITDERDVQLAIVGSGMILGRALKKKIACDGVMGLSLGEITACFLAGCIDEDTARYITDRRADFMKACVPPQGSYALEPGMPNSWMCAINNDSLRFIERRCGHVNRRNEQYGYVVVSNKNTPRQNVISGLPSAVNKAVHGIKRKHPQSVVISLRTGGPWHNKYYMANAKEEMIKLLEPIHFNSPAVPFYMMASRRFEKDPARIKYNLADAMVRTMETWEALDDIRNAGFVVFASTGPGKVLEPFYNSVRLAYVDRSEVLEEKVAETVLSK